MSFQVKRELRKIRPLRSAVYFYLSLRERARWSSRSVLDRWLEEHYRAEDPWNYQTCPEEAARFRSALNLLDNARSLETFEAAMEVGCAEGVFTAMLAPRCQSLLAVDISQAALGRAQQRCKEQHVRFEIWDLMISPAPQNLELMVVMDVLELFYRPADVHKACRKLVSAVRPGGYLLLGNSRQNEIFETAWWGRWLLRGGKRIAEHFVRHPRLQLIASDLRGIYVNALFRVN